MAVERSTSHQLRQASRMPVIIPPATRSSGTREIELFLTARSITSGSANRPSTTGISGSPSRR